MNDYFIVENLTKKFKNNVGVFDVNFKVKKGEIVGFIGANGAGKTTTIRLIFGLLKKETGRALLNGEDIQKNKLLERIAFFPDQNNYPNTYKIKEYILYNAELSGLSRKDVLKKADDLLSVLSLANNKNQTFKELSAGMQKRALLASVLITNPEIIILDEPTANLDVNSRVDFMQTLVSLAKQGVTIIITSHIITELQEIINHLMIMKEGKLVYNNSFDSQKEKIQDIYYKFHQHDSMIDVANLDGLIHNQNKKGEKQKGGQNDSSTN